MTQMQPPTGGFPNANVGVHAETPHPYSVGCQVGPMCVEFKPKVRMMQGYMMDGTPDGSDYHGGLHPYDEVCNNEPFCRDVDPHRNDQGGGSSALVTNGADPEPDWKTPPAHYSSASGIQPWDVWDEFDLDRYTANAVKYILRAGKKAIAPRLDDLIKARNYINKAIDMEENRDGTSEPG